MQLSNNKDFNGITVNDNPLCFIPFNVSQKTWDLTTIFLQIFSIYTISALIGNGRVELVDVSVLLFGWGNKIKQ